MSMKALLAELQKEYLASFPAKITTIRALWKAGKLEELHTEYHKLKGTGRTYGLPEVTQLGEALETICESKSHDVAEILETAIPISLAILDRIRMARDKGEVHQLDNDRDFGVLVEFVMGLRG